MTPRRIMRAFAVVLGATTSPTEFTASSFSLRPSSPSPLPSRSSPQTPRDAACAFDRERRRPSSASASRRSSSSVESAVDDGSGGVGAGRGAEASDADEGSPIRTSRGRTLYEVLGADPSMTKRDMKRLYIRLAKETHPDSGIGPSGVERFNEVARAWGTLSDAKLRQRYDRELAAEEFKDGVVDYARQVGEEYGPSAVKFYDDFALPLLRRTAAVAAAVQVATTYGDKRRNGRRKEEEAVATGKSAGQRRDGRDAVAAPPQTWGGAANNNPSASSWGNVPKNALSMPTRQVSDDDGGLENQSGLEDLGQTVQRVIEVGQNVTTEVEDRDLENKSLELQKRADEARAESLHVLEQLAEVKSERLRLTFLTPSANFTSVEALQFLDGFNSLDGYDAETWAERETFKRSLRRDIEQFSDAEADVERLRWERAEVDSQSEARISMLNEAARKTEIAAQWEQSAREAWENANRRLSLARANLAKEERTVTNFGVVRKRNNQDLEKARYDLKRRMDVVRRALRRRDNGDDGVKAAGGGLEEQNPPGSSINTPSLDVEWKNVASIDALREEEVQIEADFLQLVERASRLVSRSERLTFQSEELIGNEDVRRSSPG